MCSDECDLISTYYTLYTQSASASLTMAMSRTMAMSSLQKHITARIEMIDEKIATQFTVLNLKVNTGNFPPQSISGIYDSYMSRFTSVNFNPNYPYMSAAIDALLLELHLYRVEKHSYMIRLAQAS